MMLSQNLILEVFYNWNETTSQVSAFYKIEYTYNDNSKLTLRIYYKWDETTGEWIALSKMIYTYDTREYDFIINPSE